MSNENKSVILLLIYLDESDLGDYHIKQIKPQIGTFAYGQWIDSYRIWDTDFATGVRFRSNEILELGQYTATIRPTEEEKGIIEMLYPNINIQWDQLDTLLNLCTTTIPVDN